MTAEPPSSAISAPPPETREPDLLRGADEIAAFLLGDASERRRVYRLAATGAVPVFKLGATLCARRSVLLAWMTEEERRGLLQGVRQRLSVRPARSGSPAD